MRFFVAKVDTKLRADYGESPATHLMQQASAVFRTHVEQKDLRKSKTAAFWLPHFEWRMKSCNKWKTCKRKNPRAFSTDRKGEIFLCKRQKRAQWLCLRKYGDHVRALSLATAWNFAEGIQCKNTADVWYSKLFRRSMEAGICRS
jgi:hypothetical protein